MGEKIGPNEESQESENDLNLTPAVIREAMQGDKVIKCTVDQQSTGTRYEDHTEHRYDCTLEDGTQFTVTDHGDGSVGISGRTQDNEPWDMAMKDSKVHREYSVVDNYESIYILPFK